ncbi:MAG TPA: cytochrome c [Vicinamibacterales bacterium]|jgi:mono/diheme cytochrome c family protein|nr:cytochrome c [Vicinamibacterales bacterium]
MSRRQATRAVGVVILPLLVAAGGCRRTSPTPPGDAMLDAIRAEERVGGLSYGAGQGKHLFAQYCATCHGDEGRGDGQNASNLNPAPPDLTTSKNARDAAYLRRVITQGSAAAGRSALSPPWGRSLSAQQIDYLMAYCAAMTQSKR